MPNLGIAVTRRWASTDVTMRGNTFRFFASHLEAYSEAVRNAQAVQLAAMVVASSHPVIVTGDINSRPACTGVNTVAYDILVATGLAEVWPVVSRARSLRRLHERPGVAERARQHPRPPDR